MKCGKRKKRKIIYNISVVNFLFPVSYFQFSIFEAPAPKWKLKLQLNLSQFRFNKRISETTENFTDLGSIR